MKNFLMFLFLISLVGCSTFSKLRKNCSVIGADQDGYIISECDEYKK
jgi:hypothetical protein